MSAVVDTAVLYTDIKKMLVIFPWDVHMYIGCT